MCLRVVMGELIATSIAISIATTSLAVALGWWIVK